MDLEKLLVLPLHEHREFLKPCCDMINEEWPRSETARMMSLKASRDELPTSLILINDKKLVIGHCKLSPIPSIPESCFIETVVIAKALRGKKLGTYLMRKAEEYCKNKLNLKMVHLSTKGQEEFYAKLGYKVCPPVSIYGTCFNRPVSLKNIHYGLNESEQIMPSKKIAQNPEGPQPPPPPPPPPPPIVKNKKLTNNNNITSRKTFMFKYL